MISKSNLLDQRLKIMQSVLAWEGSIGNTRIRQLFGLQLVQASRLLADFRAYMGDQIFEDTKAKVWRPAKHEELIPELSLNEYSRIVESADSLFLVDARVDLTDMSPTVFSILRQAITAGKGVNISYASMNNPTFHERIIYPHSFVHAGRRWHVRAWCDKNLDFRDFTLGRIRDAILIQKEAPVSKERDDKWKKLVDIELIAHNKLDSERKQVVEVEYFNGNKAKTITSRVCLAPYVIQEIRAAINPQVEIPPEFQIEIANVDELKKILFEG